jgi:hypothetical protein
MVANPSRWWAVLSDRQVVRNVGQMNRQDAVASYRVQKKGQDTAGRGACLVLLSYMMKKRVRRAAVTGQALTALNKGL